MGLRFGLLGTGYWAAETQGAALAGHPGITFAGVWGRDAAKAGALADRYGVGAYRDVDALLADVDAVAVALPPDVQAELALRAARAGRHLLLDKPVALSASAAELIAAETGRNGLASMVFFTNRFCDDVEAFLHEAAEAGGWDGVRATLFASVFQPGNPYGASPWRREKGGLWDIGPHALSVILPVLGPVEEVAAVEGPRGTVHLLTRHSGGAAGTLSLTLDAAPAATRHEIAFHGSGGWAAVPKGERTPVEAFGAAIDRLVRDVDRGVTGDPCDVRFGREVVDVLAAAEAALRRRGTVRVSEVTGTDPA
ncbi:putative dehydrogenase [Spinactinospora alkalitolerans]|uniref:Putative dehydrogenase n=1 Tax=Spinactinospora alkalitolerans TaxID=687207 RepID=A0A852U4V7_9ACTN|nr:Gfo/Idh/MocA family oxidoreductase [Spinactinospora alkalitolerans]NYE50542.1 putative dehydrogenase [Spinactinospora alkalitolerans]